MDKSQIFFKNVFKLISGNIFAQAVPFIVSPIIARLYDAELIGVFGTIYIVSNILTLVATGRLNLYLTTQNTFNSRNQSFTNNIKFGFFTFLIIALIFLIFQYNLSEIIFGKNYFLGLVIIIALLFVNILNINIYSLANSLEQYLPMSFSKGIIGICNSFFDIILSSLGLLGLFISRFVSVISSILFLSKKSNPLKYFNLYKKLSLNNDEKKLIYYSTPQSILNNVSAIIVIFFLNGSNNIVLTGYLLWTNKIFLSPISIISVSISQVFLKDVSNLDVKKINDFTQNLVRKLFLFGLLPFSIIFFYGEEIFSFVFSENWSISGIYAQILSPWYFTVFCISPITHLAIVKNLQKQLFIIEIITTFIRVLVLIILFDRLEFVDVLSILSIIGVIYNLSILFYLKK